MDDPALIPTGDFERSGCLYTLLDIVKEDQTRDGQKYYTETVTLDSKSGTWRRSCPLLAPPVRPSRRTAIPASSPWTPPVSRWEASGYATSTRNVSATRSYPNLSEADVSLVPKSIEDSGRTSPWRMFNGRRPGGFYNAAATYTGTASSNTPPATPSRRTTPEK